MGKRERGSWIELEFGSQYLVKNDLEKAFKVFIDKILSGADGLCITREHPAKVKRRYGLESTPVVWLTAERTEGHQTVDSLIDLSILIGDFLHRAKRGVVLLDGFEYLITNHGFNPFIKFLQFIRSRFERSNSILIAPLLEGTLDMKEERLIEREMRPLTMSNELSGKSGLTVLAK
ncbi:DUF835 domain-containing protein [Candidatus Bathyarchaeota archaeon]|nr:DUF835 domain-containing protein [Candidatus Bathyarchaeota archaeon]